MTGRRLDLGEAGEVQTVPLTKTAAGNWVTAGQPRSAQSWRARIYYRGHDGLVRDVSARRKTRREAEAAAKDALAARLGAGDIEIKASTRLVAVADQWLAHIKRPGFDGLSARSVELYEQTYRRHIDAKGSTLRGLSISQANSVPRLRGFLQGISDNNGEGVSNTCKVVLSHIVEWALVNGRGAVEFNATRSLRTPKSAVPKVSQRDRTRALTPEEQSQVLTYADKRATGEGLDPRALRKAEAVADLVAFMAGTGTRISEARLVRWDHIDFEGGFVRLHGTKTKSSKRRLDLPGWLVKRLRTRVETMRAHYAHGAKYPRPGQDESRPEASARLIAAGLTVGSSGYVFASPGVLDPEKAWDKSNAADGVRAVLDGAGFTWAVGHTFRRTVATRLGEAGVPVRRIADQLGHSDTNTTLRVYLARDFDGDKSDLAAHL
ncbi:hypothetical protein GCM10027425_24740 [Alteromonas gracilis]